MKNKRYILGLGIVSIVLLSAVILFVTKDGYVADAAELNNEHMERMENMRTGSLDDVDVVINYSTVFLSE